MNETTGIKPEGNRHEEQSLNLENEAKNLMDSYSKIIDQWKILNDNYFKRVQVVMGVLQGGLFLALLQRLYPFPKCLQEAILPVFIGILGLFSAIMWMKLHTKQTQYLEFCRRNLRNLEARLTDIGLPLEYFTVESLVFGPYREHTSKLNTVKIETVELQKCKKRCLLTFKWSKETYQYSKDNKGIRSIIKVKGGLVKVEGYIVLGALIVWIIVVAGVIANLKLHFL